MPAVSQRRERYLFYFAHWLLVQRGLKIQEWLLEPAAQIDKVFASFGIHPFEVHRSRLSYCEIIIAVTERALHLKGHLPHAWDVGWTWKGLLDSH